MRNDWKRRKIRGKRRKGWVGIGVFRKITKGIKGRIARGEGRRKKMEGKKGSEWV